MKKPKIPNHIQEILAKKRKDWAKELEKEGFQRTEIAWVFNVSKVRVTQILEK